MPGRDGSGPSGFGPGTGWGAGYCRENSITGNANFIPAYRNRMGFGYAGRTVFNEKKYAGGMNE